MDARDQVDRLIHTFRAASSVDAKLDILLDLERLDDSRAVPFFLQVLGERGEATAVRARVLRRLRDGPLPDATRPLVAAALMQVASDDASSELRLPAAVALGEFANHAGVPGTLGCLALDIVQPIDLRYAAFTSLERTGPTAECVAVLRQLSADDTLGRSAQRLLSRWQLT
jgi:hypothetical protein